MEDDDVAVRRDDKRRFKPFHSLTQRFRDQVVVVTGAGRGIGRACALRLAQEGSTIYILDKRRWKETGEAVTAAQRALHEVEYRRKLAEYECESVRKSRKKDKIKAQRKPRKVRFRGRVWMTQCDVCDHKKVEAAVAAIVGEGGYIDVLRAVSEEQELCGGIKQQIEGLAHRLETAQSEKRGWRLIMRPQNQKQKGKDKVQRQSNDSEVVVFFFCFRSRFFSGLSFALKVHCFLFIFNKSVILDGSRVLFVCHE